MRRLTRKCATVTARGDELGPILDCAVWWWTMFTREVNKVLSSASEVIWEPAFGLAHGSIGGLLTVISPRNWLATVLVGSAARRGAPHEALFRLATVRTGRARIPSTRQKLRRLSHNRPKTPKGDTNWVKPGIEPVRLAGYKDQLQDKEPLVSGILVQSYGPMLQPPTPE